MADTKLTAEEKEEQRRLKKALNLKIEKEAKEKELKELEALEKSLEEQRKEVLKKLKVAEKDKKELKDDNEIIKEFCQTNKETDSKRIHFAGKCFFDIINKCNKDEKDENGNPINDFSNAYNAIGDTEWLAKLVLEHTIVGKTGAIIIQTDLLRNAVFEKKKEHDELEKKFKEKLNGKFAEFKKLEEEKAAEKKKKAEARQAKRDAAKAAKKKNLSSQADND